MEATDTMPETPHPTSTSITDQAPSLSVGVTALIVAAMALLMAMIALALRGDDNPGGTDTGAVVPVSLREFAIEPAAITVPAGGALEVTNDGGADHDMLIGDTDLSTAHLAAGESELLDVSSLEPGDYEVFCSIPGHEESGMTATLTVSEGSLPAEEGAAAETGDGHAGHGDQMTEADYQRMDEAMEESVLEFPAATEGRGNEPLEPTVVEDGVLEFELTAEIVPWEVEPGTFVDAWTYNGMVPGPVIEADVGDTVRIVLDNQLPMGTDLHVHGVNLPNEMDGVAPVTQPLIEPGGSFTYEFVADRPAVAIYHAHHHGQLQVPNGMLGTLLVGDMELPTGGQVGGIDIPDDVEIAQEFPMVLNDSGVIGYSLNGKSFPATEPVTAEVGDWFLVHYVNEGSQVHPMHLHQFEQIVVARDGFPLDEPYVVDTLNVAPGERYTVLFQATDPGTWVWHCHILSHAERETGMFGMVTAIVVE